MTQVAPAPESVLRIIQDFWLSRVVYIAAKLGIADLLSNGPKSVAELAENTGTHGPTLYRVMRALASAGWFAQDETGRFELTPPAAALQSDVPGSLRFLAMTELGEEHYPAWEDLLYSVQTGETAFNHVFGMPNWDFWAKNPDNANTFNRAMANVTAVTEQAIMGSYSFSGIRKIVDVGGGSGSLMTAILKADSQTRGVIYDLPHVVEGARSRIASEALADRCEVVAGSMFDSVPGGGDAYVLKWIIHDWDEEKSVAILANCRRAMGAHAKLLLIESVIPPGNQPYFHKFMDLNMLVMTGGRERTEAEFRSLLEAAGFRLDRIVNTPAEVSVLEATFR